MIAFVMMACAGQTGLAVSGETAGNGPAPDPTVLKTEGAAPSGNSKTANAQVRDEDVAAQLEMLQFMDMLEHFDLIKDLDVIQGGGK